MIDVKNLIINKKQYQNFIIKKRLKSRKNKVYLINYNNNLYILKIFNSDLRENLQNEYKILKQGSSKLNIPKPIKFDNENNTILIEYIDGLNFCDIINNDKISFFEKKKHMNMLAKWYYDFHIFFKKSNKYLIRGDSILRNFILTDILWGVDFEESRYGQPTEDIASMCVSILSTDPMFNEEKIKLCSVFIRTYEKMINKKLININYQISKVLLENVKRRKNGKDILKDYACKIRNESIIF